MMKKLISCISGLLLIILTFLCARYRGLLSMHGGETMSVNTNGPRFFLCLAAAVIASALLYTLTLKRGHGLNPSAVFKVCAVIEFISGLYLIFNVNHVLYYDEKHIYDAVQAFHIGDFRELEPGGYLYSAPHQLGLLAYESLLNAFSSDIGFFFLVNLFEVLGIQYLQWKLCAMMFPGRERVEVLCILVSAAFLPLLFFTLWLYGEIPGLFFLLLCVWLSFRAMREHKPLLWIPALLCGGAAYLLRNNNLIPLIALALVILLESLREKKFLRLCAIPALFVLCFGMGAGVKAYYTELTGSELGGGVPMALYAAMGLQDKTADGINPGWYNQFNWTVYKESGYDAEASTDTAVEAIRERLNEFGAEPGAAVDFFLRKLITTWCDPTYQSLWCSPLHIFSGPMTSEFLQSLRGENKGLAYWAVVIFCNVLNVMIFGFAFRGLFEKERDNLSLFPLLLLCGLFFFHLVWETKSRYVLAAPYLLIPLACAGFDGLCRGLGIQKRTA